jgi:hypothetical protein
MSISTADKKKRAVIPGARPGDVFDVHQLRFMSPETIMVSGVAVAIAGWFHNK